MRVTDEMVLAGAREVCARWSKACGVDPEDNWKVYSDEHKEEARAILEAALAQQAGAVDSSRLEWVSKHWGGQRNDYASHVLRRGGTGDLSDIRSFVDEAIASSAPGGGGESSKENDRD